MLDVEVFGIVENRDVLSVGGSRRGVLVVRGVCSSITVQAGRRLRWHCDFSHIADLVGNVVRALLIFTTCATSSVKSCGDGLKKSGV